MSGTTIRHEVVEQTHEPDDNHGARQTLDGVADMARFSLAPGGALYCCENAVWRLYVHPKS